MQRLRILSTWTLALLFLAPLSTALPAPGDKDELQKYHEQLERDRAALAKRMQDLVAKAEEAAERGQTADVKRLRAELAKVKTLLGQLNENESTKKVVKKKAAPKKTARKKNDAPTGAKKGKVGKDRLRALFVALLKARESGDEERERALRDEIRAVFDASSNANKPKTKKRGNGQKKTKKGDTLVDLWAHLERLERGMINATSKIAKQPEVVNAEKQLVGIIKAIHKANEKGDAKVAARLRAQAKTIFDRLVALHTGSAANKRPRPDDRVTSPHKGSVVDLWKHIEKLENALLHAKDEASEAPEVVATEKRLRELILEIHSASESGKKKQAEQLREQARRVLEKVIAARTKRSMPTKKSPKVTKKSPKVTKKSPKVTQGGGSIQAAWEHLQRLEQALIRIENRVAEQPEIIATETRLREIIEAAHRAKIQGRETEASRLREQARRVFERLLAVRNGQRSNPTDEPTSTPAARIRPAARTDSAALEELWQHIARLEAALIRIEKRVSEEPEVVAVETRLREIVEAIHLSNKSGDRKKAEKLRDQARRILEKLIAARSGD